MNVVFITLVDLTGTSGQNVYSRNVAGALAGHDDVSLTLVCPDPERELPRELSTACESINRLSKKASRSLRWHLQIQLILYRRLDEILQSKDIDLVLSTLRPSLLIPPCLTRQHNIRYRIFIEGNISHEVDNILSLPFVSILSDFSSIWNIRTSERCYAVNHDVKRWARSLPLSESTIEVIPHGIDVPELLRHSEHSPKLTSEHEFVLCYVGSFKTYHCLQPLIKAISQLRDDGIDVGLSLVGTGPELGSVQEAVNEHGISAATTFHGFVDPAEVPGYIRSADVCYGVIDPSRTGSPMKVYEYLASGTPVIASKSEEFEFIEEERVGVLIEEPALKVVADAIEQLYNTSISESSQMRKRAQNAGYKHGHTWAEFADRLVLG